MSGIGRSVLQYRSLVSALSATVVTLALVAALLEGAEGSGSSDNFITSADTAGGVAPPLLDVGGGGDMGSSSTLGQAGPALADVKVLSQTIGPSPPGHVRSVAIDMDPFKTPANPGNGTLGSREACVSKNVGETFDIDLTVTGVDPTDRVSGFDLTLNYDPAKLKVVGFDNLLMIAAGGGTIPFDFTDPVPDTDGSFRVALADFGPNAESGDGVLSRITMESIGPGISPLTLADVIVAGDDQGPDGLVVDRIDDAQEAQNEPCPQPLSPATPSLPFSEGKVGEPFSMIVETTVHNNGPSGPVDVSVSDTVTAPPDCTVTPTTDDPTLATLHVSVSTHVTAQFQVVCTSPSFHDFSVETCISISGPGVNDPDPGNDCHTASVTIGLASEADVRMTGFTFSCGDDTVDANTVFTCQADATVHNDGPAGPVNADVDFQLLFTHPDCAVAPGLLQTADDLSLAVSVSQTVSRSWSVSCADAAFVSLFGRARVVVDQLHRVDPIRNELGAGPYEVRVFDVADLKVTAVTVDCDDPVWTDEPFDCLLEASVHNNGPEAPVDADVTITLGAPPDCHSGSHPANVRLQAGTTVTLSLTFETICALRSNHVFTATAEAQLDGFLLRDPDPSNNTAFGQDANVVFDRADAKVAAVAINCPANADAGVPFVCAVEATLHNNGPLRPVDVGGAVNVGVPDDCTVEDYKLFGQGFGLLSLAVSLSQTVSKSFSITCTDNGLHQIVGCAIAEVQQTHVRDQVPLANNYGTATTMIDIVDPLLLVPRRCTALDPPEICGNGVDDDGDTLIDEEPDTDRDGVNNCDDPDDDGDGYSDAVEAYIGTAPLAGCPWVVGVHPAWPPDFDNSQAVDIVDVLQLKPVFGSPSARHDLDASGGNINIVDVLRLKPVFGTSCTP